MTSEIPEVQENPDENVWEDVVDSEAIVKQRTTCSTQHGCRASIPVSLTHSAARTPAKAVFVSNSRRNHRPKKLPRLVNSALFWEQVIGTCITGIGTAAEFSADVIQRSIRWLRRPLSFFFFVWFLALITFKIFDMLRSAFTPLCILPGISYSGFCTPVNQESRTPKWADYPKMMDVQSATFEQLLDESVGGSSLALEIKKTEIATVDLIALVKLSELHSKDKLAGSLMEFVEDAKAAGRGLQKLNAKVAGTVDGIIAVNDFALHAIESAMTRSTFSKPPLSHVFHLIPIFPPRDKHAQKVVMQTFTEAMSLLSSSIQRLIVEASLSLSNLDKLEERLSNIHEQVSRENSSLSSAKSELLSQLWTTLGGNKRQMHGYDEHLFLLKNLSAYRRKALVHVLAALNALQTLNEDMEELRERVTLPVMAGSSIPVEVHMRSIKRGLERLEEGRANAKEREFESVKRVLSISQ